VQGGDVAEVEQLELRHDLQLLGAPVELHHERPRVHEDLVAEVDRAARQRAGVRPGLQNAQPVLVRVGDRAAGGQLDDQIRALAQRPHRVAQPGQVERGPGVVVPDVHVDDRRPGGLALLGRLDEFVKGDGQGRDVRLGGLRAGRRHRDERHCSHARQYRLWGTTPTPPIGQNAWP
jgi:hypothetical protein